ncbi:hypothetical protein CDAR_519301 [Caerostris darwini]|uniref:Uncharacterized protein n=1 Tax=Caerostris darwini TaxID=1538125 RepID=A0AAV4PQH7_9ARAC|nr:hypothetical protein CDAR_519301 [Caerostris darwini]
MNFPSNRFHEFRVDLSSSDSHCRLRFSKSLGGGGGNLKAKGVEFAIPHYGGEMNLCQIRLDIYWLVIIIIIVDGFRTNHEDTPLNHRIRWKRKINTCVSVLLSSLAIKIYNNP